MASRLAMFLYSPFRSDSRVLREASTLARSGYDVRVIALRDPPGTPDPVPAFEQRDGFRVIRVDGEPLLGRLLSWRARWAREGADGAATGRNPEQYLGASRQAADRATLSPGAGPAAPAGESASRLPAPIGAPLNAGIRKLVRGLRFVRFWRRAVGVVRDEAADVYVAHDLTGLPAGYLAKRLVGGKLVYDSHELFVERAVRHTALSRWALTRAEGLLIRAADRTIAVNESIAEELAARYGVERPSVIRNVPDAAAAPASPSRSLDADIPDGDGRRIVLYLGGFTPNRGLEEMIEAAPHLPEATIALVGPGSRPYLRALAERAEALGVSDRVHLLPPVSMEEVIPYSRDAHVGVSMIQNVCLNNYYSLPNKVFQYIHAGLPVVTSDFPELARLVNGYGLGRTCDPRDPRQIAAAIEEVLADGAYQEMSENAVAAAESLNWEKERARFIGLINEL